MVEDKQLSVEISVPNLLVLNIWCKVENITQKQAISRLIEEYAPKYRMVVEEI